MYLNGYACWAVSKCLTSRVCENCKNTPKNTRIRFQCADWAKVGSKGKKSRWLSFWWVALKVRLCFTHYKNDYDLFRPVVTCWTLTVTTALRCQLPCFALRDTSDWNQISWKLRPKMSRPSRGILLIEWKNESIFTLKQLKLFTLRKNPFNRLLLIRYLYFSSSSSIHTFWLFTHPSVCLFNQSI